ncbi:16S rRNA (cytosine(967)-C(5))-methyltransferase RsmB [Salsuginibacillus kocurii]|uniref:16S rRNA (cytosine(967)-C(5))-methyltransferase RsmB n=1 Tax=Salsuginibacillus kocurii TaxID=427078 RepID=UPI0003755E23|nr:16S rRNA (cytosine(967)-C(5))-methyltransferase RsmB [Salsuginibacillus kocurii]
MSKHSVRDHALTILERVEQEGAYSHLLINHVLEEHDMDPKDRALLTELVYGTIKRSRTLDFYLQPFLKQPIQKMDNRIRIILRLAAYQMVYLDRIPARAAIFEAVHLAKTHGRKGLSGLVNGVLRNLDRKGIPDVEKVKHPLEQLEIKTSHPRWILTLWEEGYGKGEAENIARSHLETPLLTIRTQTLKITRDDLMKKLEEEGFQVEKGNLAEEAILIQKGDPFSSKAYAQGLFTVQDESSMLVAHAANPKKGDKIADLCAAPGGKTTHMAEVGLDSAFIFAFDLYDQKVLNVKQQAMRLGLSSIQVAQMDARQASEELEEETFDVVLVDAPCSGLGVIKRKPEIKEHMKQGTINEILTLQESILKEAAKLVKPGGRLVYSTCTLNPAENEKQLTAFLNDQTEFAFDQTLFSRLPVHEGAVKKSAEGAVTILPHMYQTDGFFIAAMQKETL